MRRLDSNELTEAFDFNKVIHMESYFNQAEIFHIIVDVDVELSYRTALI